MTSSILKQDNIAELIFPVLALLNICFFTGFLTSVSASTDIIDNIELTVPVACTMSGTRQTSHNATLNPGTYSGASGSEYEAGIGKTTITTYCNDNNGFSIYAIGFTGDLYEGESHTKLIGQNTNQSISTKVYANGDTDSNWSMKVSKVDNPVSGDPITYNPDNMSIQNSFNSWHEVPDTYTKVAQYNSSTTDPATTDTTLGAKIETTYATYISSSQPADTYTGQVKYTMVHPYDHTAPEPPSFKVLYTGRALSNTPGQENPVTVRMADLPASGRYNLLGTADGLYDKLTDGTLYGGYGVFKGDENDIEQFLEEYTIYDGTNMDFSTFLTIKTTNGANIVPSEALYIVKEVPEDVYLTLLATTIYTSSTQVVNKMIYFTAIDNKSYRQIGFEFSEENTDETIEHNGTVTASYSIRDSNDVLIDLITPTTVNINATGLSNRLSYWKDENNEYLFENNIVEITPYWLTPDYYRVTGAYKTTINFSDLRKNNIVKTIDHVSSRISL